MKHPYLLCRFFEMLLGIFITAIGLSCMMKSQLGQTAITSFTQNITRITGMKSGTVLIIFFLSCTRTQMLFAMAMSKNSAFSEHVSISLL